MFPGCLNMDENEFLPPKEEIKKSPTKSPTKRRKDIPERWENYRKCGQSIPETPFVAFKVPLSERLQRIYDQNYSALSISVEKNPIWTLKELEKTVPNLDLIIDVTNTDRYYNPKNLSEHIKYCKIKTLGHVIPNHHVIGRFFKAVNEMLSHKKDALIGVHCTHGVNRTGYLICRYLIEKLNWAPQKAIDEFNFNRGHPIERQNYIDDLKTGQESGNWGSNPGNESQLQKRNGNHKTKNLGAEPQNKQTNKKGSMQQANKKTKNRKNKLGSKARKLKALEKYCFNSSLPQPSFQMTKHPPRKDISRKIEKIEGQEYEMIATVGLSEFVGTGKYLSDAKVNAALGLLNKLQAMKVEQEKGSLTPPTL